LTFAAGLAGQQSPAGPADGAISGTVYDGVTHQPIAGVVVNLTPWAGPEGQPFASVTDQTGRFVFAGLGEEQRSMTAHKAGYLEAVYGLDGSVLGSFSQNIVGMSGYGIVAPIRLTPGQWLQSADLVLWPAASVTGTVTDEYGEPFVDQLVSVLAQDPVGGYPRWSNVGTALTDDRGRYFVGRLAPGRYVIAAPAAATPEQTTGTLRPGRYYPNALRLMDATPVTVTAGARLAGLDIARLPTPVSRVSGRVTGGARQDWPPMLLVLTQAGDPDIGPRGYVAIAVLEANGTFVFPRVPPGAYVIRTSPSVGQERSPVEVFGSGPNQLPRQWAAAASPGAVTAPFFAHTSITVGAADLLNVVVALEDAVTLSGVVTSDGARLSSLFAEPADSDAGPASANAQLDATGAFVIDGLAPGAYFLRTTARTPIRSIRLGGREMIDQPIEASVSMSGISVGVTDMSSIHGEVRASGTSPSARTAVIYFPADRQLWTQVSSKSPRFGLVYVSTDGNYVTGSLPGGDYDIVAVPQNSWLDRWRSEAFIEAATRMATTVHLDWSKSIQQDLQVQEVRLP
jgi:hypothetical protein